MAESYLCPVCREDGFAEPPWGHHGPSFDICPACGIRFGYEDNAAGDVEARRRLWAQWRQRWLDQGSPWHDAPWRRHCRRPSDMREWFGLWTV